MYFSVFFCVCVYGNIRHDSLWELAGNGADLATLEPARGPIQPETLFIPSFPIWFCRQRLEIDSFSPAIRVIIESIPIVIDGKWWENVPESDASDSICIYDLGWHGPDACYIAFTRG